MSINRRGTRSPAPRPPASRHRAESRGHRPTLRLAGHRWGSIGLWAAALAAAGLTSTMVDGTMASWTTAVVGNSTNSAAMAQAVILREVSGATTCLSSASASNSSSCTTIDNYGGVASPLTPGTSQVTTLVFTNAGAAAGATFSLAPGSCSQTPAVGSGIVPAPNLCTAANEVTVAISCSAGASYNAGAAWADLAYSAAVAPTATKTHTVASADLAGGASWTCQITVALAAGAAVADQAITVTQPLVWTLTA